MTEHKICKDCKWNKYPICEGTLDNGVPVRIDSLRKEFECGQKFRDIPFDLKVVIEKSALELKIEELEAKINKLEEVKSK